MKDLLRRSFAPTIIGLLLVLSGVPADAGRRGAVKSAYDGTWSVAIYTLRGGCGSVRSTPRTKVTEPTALSEKMVRSG